MGRARGLPRRVPGVARTPAFYSAASDAANSPARAARAALSRPPPPDRATLKRPFREPPFAMSRLARLLAALSLLALTGCLATAPRIELKAVEGTVRADSQAHGWIMADLLDELTPQVRRLLPDMRERPVEVWVQRELEVYAGFEVDRQVPAFTIEGDGRIHVAEADSNRLSAALAHELVHSLLGESWSTLPSVAEEGLADWVQEQLHPEFASAMRADYLAKASAAVGGLPLELWNDRPLDGTRRVARFTYSGPEGLDRGTPVDPIRALDEGDRGEASFWQPYEVSVSDPRLYGVGYLVVQRIIDRRGVAGLHALCVQAAADGLPQVPGRTLAEAADLGPDLSLWRAAVVAEVGPGELAVLARSMLGRLAQLVKDGWRDLAPELSGWRFARTYRPKLGVVGRTIEVPLWRLRGWRTEMYGIWPAGHALAAGSSLGSDPTGGRSGVSWGAALSEPPPHVVAPATR